MATTVVMEALSPTMEEGRLVKWTKREGDAVKSGEPLAEVETDKAVMELVARTDGHLLKQVVAEGATVPVGDVVAFIGKPGEPIPTTAPAPALARAAAGPPAGGPTGPTRPAPAPSVPAAAVQSPPREGRIKASPLARRIAHERGVDLRRVAGSGPGGRVVLRDLERAVAVAPAEPPSLIMPAPATADADLEQGVVPFENVPLTQIRKTIARRLTTSLGPVPHFFLTTEVDMERAAEAREALNRQLADQAQRAEAIKISINDIILKATATALTHHRACNAWFQDDHVRYWNVVHLGMAVAVDDGLITPVIRNAHRKSLSRLGTEARALAGRARERRLQPEEYTGSTFSVSNLGMFDIDQFTAVINPPEAGILAVGSVTPKAVVVEGQVAIRRQVRLTMSCDHRVIDGATGAAFLRTLKQMLENPLAMLL
jgi:pyruvate dehydrogenase E2 component (dihydrolipoamide acetyltransferase)